MQNKVKAYTKQGKRDHTTHTQGKVGKYLPFVGSSVRHPNGVFSGESARERENKVGGQNPPSRVSGPANRQIIEFCTPRYCIRANPNSNAYTNQA